MAYHR